MSTERHEVKYPVDALVGIEVLDAHETQLGVLVLTEDGPVTHVHLAKDKADAYVQAISYLATEFSQYPVNLYCSDEKLGEAMRSLGTWKNIEVMDAKLLRYHGSERDLNELFTRSDDKLERVVVACDGSHSASQKTGGWGFVSELGQYGQGSGKSLNSTYAELKAIELALKSVPGHGRELVFTVDSKEAIALLENGVKDSTPVRIRRLVARITLSPNFHRAKFQWVRGHSGDPLNEAANRLAIAARRNSDSGTSGEVARNVAQSILSEHLAAV